MTNRKRICDNSCSRAGHLKRKVQPLFIGVQTTPTRKATIWKETRKKSMTVTATPMNRSQRRKASKQKTSGLLNYSQQSNSNGSTLNGSQQSVPNLEDVLNSMKAETSIPPEALKMMEQQIQSQNPTIGTTDASVDSTPKKTPSRSAGNKYEVLRLQLYLYGATITESLKSAGTANPKFLQEAMLWNAVVMAQGQPSGNMIDHLVELSKQQKWVYDLLCNLVSYSLVAALLTDTLTLVAGTVKIFEIKMPSFNPFKKSEELPDAKNNVQPIPIPVEREVETGPTY